MVFWVGECKKLTLIWRKISKSTRHLTEEIEILAVYICFCKLICSVDITPFKCRTTRKDNLII